MQNLDDQKQQDQRLTEASIGRLSAEDRAILEAELAAEPSLQDELAFSEALAAQVKNASEATTPEAAIPSDFVWKRLQRSIEGLESESETTAATDSNVTQLRPKTPAMATNKRPQRWLGGLAMAACLLVMVQAGFIYNQLGTDNGGYGLAGGNAVSESNGPVLQLQFASDLTVGEIQGLLAAHRASIVSGPSSVGLYRIQLPEGSNAQQVMTALQSSSTGIVHIAKE